MVQPNHHISILTPQRLQAYVIAYKVYRFFDDAPIPLSPDGHFEFIIQADRSILQKSSTGTEWVLRPKAFVGGLHNRHYEIKATSNDACLVSVQFKPGAARYFIPEQLHRLKNQIVDISAMYGTRKEQELAAIQPNAPEQFIVTKVEDFLLNIFQPRKDSCIRHALDVLYQGKGRGTVRQLAKAVYLSEVQFRKRFREEVGLSPKEYSKIVRVNAVKEIVLQSASPVRFTELSYQFGYFDQAHFIKDFSSVVGVSPRRFWAQYHGR